MQLFTFCSCAMAALASRMAASTAAGCASARAQRAFLDGVSRLADHGIRTFLVHGNHDPVREGWTAITTFPDAVHRFSETEVESVELTVDGEQVVIHGTSYATSATTDNLALRFPAATPRAFNVGLLHANLGGLGSKHQDYSPCTVDDLRRTGYQYWALGHVHEHRIWRGETTIAFPGNLQGRHIREPGPRGALLVSATGSEIDAVERLAPAAECLRQATHFDRCNHQLDRKSVV